MTLHKKLRDSPNGAFCLKEKFLNMKKIIIMFALVLGVALNAGAQSLNGEKYATYCEMMGYSNFGVGKLKVLLDFGSVPNTKQSESIYGEDGKKMKFNSVVDAINYMAKRGWTVKANYALSEGSRGLVNHFLLEKWVTSDSEVKEGLITKNDD